MVNKDDVNSKRAAIEQDRQNHAAAMKSQEEAHQNELQSMKNQEEFLQQQEKEAKEFALKQEKELLEARNELIKLNQSQYDATSKDNKDRLQRAAELNANILKLEAERESNDKNKLADRNATENIRMEERQKEVEAEHADRLKDTLLEKSTIQESGIAEAIQNALQIDQARSKHNEEVLALKQEQNKVELEGFEIEKAYAENSRQLKNICAAGQAALVAAHKASLDDRQKFNTINNILTEKDVLIDSATKIIAKVNVAVKKGNPTKLTAMMIMKVIQKFNASIKTIQSEITSPVFKYMDKLDEERRAVGDRAMETISSIKNIVEEWNTLSSEGYEPSEIVDAMNAELGNFRTLVEQLSEQLRSIPFPIQSGNKFDAAIAMTCQAIANNVITENETLEITNDSSNTVHAIE